jgi:ketosteroid isomerase-like protein
VSAPAVSRSAEGVIRDLFAAADARDADRSAAFLAEDFVFRFGNADPISDVEAFRQMATEFNASLAGLRHEIRSILATDREGVVVTELAVHYTRLDGSVISLPCCNIFALDGDLKVTRYQIFMDISPVFAGEAPE